MQQTNEVHNVSSDTSRDESSGVEVTKHFINDDNYQLLKDCQQAIYLQTDVSITVRKMINEIITVENLNKVKTKYLSILGG